MDSGWFKWQINIIGWSQNFREGQRLWRSSRDHSPSHTGDWPGEDPPPPWGLGLWALIQRPQTADPWALSGDTAPTAGPPLVLLVCAASSTCEFPEGHV